MPAPLPDLPSDRELRNEARFAKTSTEIVELRGDIRDVKASMDRVELKVNSRPSWAVAAYITLSTSVAVGLAAAIAAASLH